MIKKTAACMFCALFFFIILTACDNEKNSEVVGNWIPATVTINGTTVQYSSLDIEEEQFGFNFSDNGNCTATMTGITNSGTYTFNGTSIDIIINGENKKLNYDSGTLTLTLDYEDNSMQIAFIKER